MSPSPYLNIYNINALYFLKACFWFLLVWWSVGKCTFLARSALFLTSQFSGRQCDQGVSLGISNQEMLYPVMLVLEKLDPGESLAWQGMKEPCLQRNLKESKGSGRRVREWSRFLDHCDDCSLIQRNFSPCFRCFWNRFPSPALCPMGKGPGKSPSNKIIN